LDVSLRQPNLLRAGSLPSCCSPVQCRLTTLMWSYPWGPTTATG